MLNNPIFKIKFNELNEQELWKHYDQCLRQHDWGYEYSDDNRYWTNGTVESSYLGALKEKLKSIDKIRANNMYFMHSPFHNNDGTLHSI